MTVKKWFVGFVLAVVMVATLGVCAILFSARDFQYGLAQFSPETNGLIVVDELLAVEERIAEIERETADIRGEQLEIQAAIQAIDDQAALEQAQVAETRAQIVGNLAAIEQRAVPNAQNAAADLDTSVLNARVMALTSVQGLPPADQQAIATLREQVTALAAREEALDTREADRLALVARQRQVDGQVAESDRRINALQQSVVPDYEHYPRVRSEVLALKNMSPLGVGAMLAQGHPAFVSTVLVLLMGALGAILYLFPAYLTRVEPVTFAEIAVRLIFGMCAALAFYVIANATIAGFSLTEQQQVVTTSAGLNPFTVGLIGIVAGVLAEDIAKWIKDRSKGVFTQSSGAPPPAAAPAAAEDPGYAGVNPHGGPNAP